jgi:hypothetical protein
MHPARTQHQRLDLLLAEHQRRQHEARAQHIAHARLAIDVRAFGLQRVDVAIEGAQRHARRLGERRAAHRMAVAPQHLNQVQKSLRP